MKPRMKTKKKKEFIDFSKLSRSELANLRKKWEGSARIFEATLQRSMDDPKIPSEKIASLWNVGGALWRRVRVLEKWLVKQKR